MSKTLLTIGAGPGIGLATARTFAERGFRVVLASTNPAKLARHAAEFLGKGTDHVIETVDARKPAEVADLVTRTQADVVHYNVGALRYNADGSLQMLPLADFPRKDIASDIQMNLASALVAIQAAIPVMRSKGGGTLLLTGGGLAMNPHADLLTLSAGKAGLRASAQALFEPLREIGIHVALVSVSTLVSPGSAAAAGVAQAFWKLHAQPRSEWTWETVYR